MGFPFELAAAAGLAAAGLGSLLHRVRGRRRAGRSRDVLERAAVALQLQPVEADGALVGLAGQLSGYEVYVDDLSADAALAFAIRVERSGAIPPDLLVTRWSGYHDPLNLGAGREQGPFVKIDGDGLVRHVLIDEHTEQALHAVVVGSGVCVRGGAVTRRLDGDEVDVPALVGAVDEAIFAARLVCLAEPRVAKRALSALARDPSPVMRLGLLEILIRYFPEHQGTTDAARDATQDSDARLRFVAARFLGAEGVPFIEAIAGSELAEPSLRAEALEDLAGRLPGALPPLLDAALQSSSTRVLEAALGVLMRAFFPADFRPERLEPRLIELIGHADEAVAAAAISALGRYGTVTAVGPLLALTKGLFRSRERADRARLAADWIQERLGDVEHGTLALADRDDAGALSLRREEGALSVSDETGALSPPPSR